MRFPCPVAVLTVCCAALILCQGARVEKKKKPKKTTTTTTTTTAASSVAVAGGFATAGPPLPAPTLVPQPGGGVSREGCVPPDVLVNGSSRGVGSTDFSSVQEVQFLGVIGPLQQKRVCKIKCLNGVWVGPLCTLDPGSKKFQPMLRPCFLAPPPPEVRVSFEGRELEGGPRGWGGGGEELALPHGSVLELRCSRLGLHKFVGQRSLRCGNGQWSGPLPICQNTSTHHNLSEDVSPSLVYTVVSGDAGVSDSGELVVLPNSIVHFDCLLRRQDKSPSWTSTATHRQYPSAWSMSAEDRSWRYRLSIYYAKESDNGQFTCTSPRGLANELHVRVTSVECPPIDSTPDRHRVMSAAEEGRRMHGAARFACVEGFELSGPEEIVCTPDGRWSLPPPRCEVIQCPALDTEEEEVLRVESHNRTYGSRVPFSCPSGYRLVGNPVIICLKNQTWSDSPPHCQAIECSPPLAPSNGRVLDSGRYLTGDFLQFTCNAGFVIVGESITVCDDHGQWTFPPPTCKPACEFPGEPAHGHVVPTKFHYDIGEMVNVECLHGFRVLGSPRLRCTSTGHWSSPLAHCRRIIPS